MSYTKFAASVVRANPSNFKNVRISAARCRSSVASPKSQEEKEQHAEERIVVEAEPLELISQSRNVKEKQLEGIRVDFDNTREAYRSKGNVELLRSLLVFKLCSIDVLVEKNKEVNESSGFEK